MTPKTGFLVIEPITQIGYDEVYGLASFYFHINFLPFQV
jgi:hypothetical protein